MVRGRNWTWRRTPDNRPLTGTKHLPKQSDTRPMRRALLPLLVASFVVLAGCAAIPSGSDTAEPSSTSSKPVPTGPDTRTETTTPTDTWTPGGTGAMGPDSSLVRLSVAANFSGDVTLDGSCLDEPRAVEAGETTAVEREAAGETCSFTLSVNGTVAASEDVADYETAIVEVTANGSVDVGILAA